MQILIVDDQPETAQLLSMFLLMQGHSVDAVYDGQEAMDKLERRRYDCVITDFIMPRVSGLDLYNHLQRQYPTLAQRTIFISGNATRPPIRDFLENVGRERFIQKPFDVTQMTQVIDDLSIAC